MNKTTQGLVIREENIGEADRIVTILTAENGLIRAFATGARNIKSKRISSTALFCYSRFSISEKRGTYRVLEAEPIQSFFSLRQNIIKMALASYFCDIALSLAPMEESGEDFLRLLLNSLHYISSEEKDANLIKSIYEFRVICSAGYEPDLEVCSSCGKENFTTGWVSEQGDVFCPYCKNEFDRLLFLNETVLRTLKYIAKSDIKSLFSFKISGENIHSLNNITEKYLIYQSEQTFKTLGFYKSLTD